MKYNTPPTSVKSARGVDSSIVGIKSTLLLLKNVKSNKQSILHNYSEYKENLKYNNKEFLCPKESTDVTGSGTCMNDNETIPRNFEKFGSLTTTDLKSPIIQDSNDKICPRTKLTSNIPSKKFCQGESSLGQQNLNPFAVITNQSSTSEHKLHKLNTESQYNMFTRAMKKLYTINSSPPVVDGSSPPKSVTISKVTEALVEPLPEDRGKCKKPFQKPKKIRKIVAITKDNVDAIDISFDDGRVCDKPKRILTNLSESNHVDDGKTSITTENKNSSTVKKPVNVVQTTTKQKSEEKENYHNHNTRNKAITKRKRNVNPNTPKPKPKIKQQNTKRNNKKVKQLLSRDTSDTETVPQKTTLSFQNITERRTTKECNDDFTLLIDSIKDHVLNPSSNVSLNTKPANNSVLSNKNSRFRNKRITNTKKYYDLIMRKAANDGYESLESDSDLSSLIKKPKYTSTTIKDNSKKRKLKSTNKRLNFQPIFKSQKKSQSSTISSVFPELEFECESLSKPHFIKGFSDSDSIYEDNIPGPVKVSDNIVVLSNICLKEGLENKNTDKECGPVVVNIDCDVEVPPIQIIDDDANLKMDIEKDSTILLPKEEVTVVNNMLNSSCTLSELTGEYSNEAISSWVATGLPSDATEVFKSIVEAVVSQYADTIKVCLEALRGPIHPSLLNLHELLMKQDREFTHYFKKK